MLTWRLKIKDKQDDNLLKQFPQDQFANVKIITKSKILKLTSSYLILDSNYFSQIFLQKNQIDLSQLPQRSLINVLRSFYGDSLFIENITQLQQIYDIVQKLQIQDYKKNIYSQILKQHTQNNGRSIFSFFQITQFCINKNILKSQVIQYHVVNQCKILQNSKNYLKLASLSDSTIHLILAQFYQTYRQKSESRINVILQSYLNKKNKRSTQYFDYYKNDPHVQILKNIWDKFHFKFEKKKSNDQITSLGRYNSSIIMRESNTFYTNSFIPQNPKNQLQLDQKILFLQRQIKTKDQTITQLQKEYQILKKIKQQKKNNKQSQIVQHSNKNSLKDKNVRTHFGITNFLLKNEQVLRKKQRSKSPDKRI